MVPPVSERPSATSHRQDTRSGVSSRTGRRSFDPSGPPSPPCGAQTDLHRRLSMRGKGRPQHRGFPYTGRARFRSVALPTNTILRPNRIDVATSSALVRREAVHAASNDSPGVSAPRRFADFGSASASTAPGLHGLQALSHHGRPETS